MLFNLNSGSMFVEKKIEIDLGLKETKTGTVTVQKDILKLRIKEQISEILAILK